MNSKNKHATKHSNTTGHPIVQSFQETGQGWEQDWKWCSIKQVLV